MGPYGPIPFLTFSFPPTLSKPSQSRQRPTPTAPGARAEAEPRGSAGATPESTRLRHKVSRIGRLVGASAACALVADFPLAGTGFQVKPAAF